MATTHEIIMLAAAVSGGTGIIGLLVLYLLARRQAKSEITDSIQKHWEMETRADEP